MSLPRSKTLFMAGEFCRRHQFFPAIWADWLVSGGCTNVQTLAVAVSTLDCKF